MENQYLSSIKRRRTATGVVAGVLAAALFLGGTFAWRDYDQHKSNIFVGDEMRYSVTLNEDFDHVKNWSIYNTPRVKKEINVTNTGMENGTFGDVFVRLQLREFMQLTPTLYEYSPERYMVAMPNKTGGSDFVNEINALLAKSGVTNPADLAQFGEGSYENFVTFNSKEAAEAFITAAGSDAYWTERMGNLANRKVTMFTAMEDVLRDASGKPVLHPETKQEQPIERWYIQTVANDPNGQYGKYVPLRTLPQAEDAKVVTERGGVTPPNASMYFYDDTHTQPHDDGTQNCLEWQGQQGWIGQEGKEVCTSGKTQAQHTNGECSYLAHTWGGTNLDACDLATHNYVKWYLGAEVITMKEWRETYNKPVNKWVVDTESAEGWVYWGQPLRPGQTTSNLLNEVELVKQPDDKIFYVLHTDMEAVALNEIENWLSAAPQGNQGPEDFIKTISGLLVTEP